MKKKCLCVIAIAIAFGIYLGAVDTNYQSADVVPIGPYSITSNL